MKHTIDEPIQFGNAHLSINPGSDNIIGGNEQNAIDNIRHFITDLKINNIKFVRVPQEDEEGRFAFLLWKYHCEVIIAHLVLMPGLFLSNVRFIDEKIQRITDFPRLYVDGHSGVWMFSLDVCFCELEKEK